jgi:hypothetical protein
LQRVVRALIERQRDLASSPRTSSRLRILWIAALLDKRLARCSDREIGDLLSFAQDRFHIFEPEFAICHHARRRLMLRNLKEDFTE